MSEPDLRYTHCYQFNWSPIKELKGTYGFVFICSAENPKNKKPHVFFNTSGIFTNKKPHAFFNT